MRLYLSSYRLGHASEELLRLLNGSTRALIVTNALDFIPADAQERYRKTSYDPVAAFAEIGIAAQLCDLRAHPDMDALLDGYGLVWVLGGNSFILRRAMKMSGFDKAIRTALDRDAIVYGGFSAGAVAATPTLRGIEMMDDPHQVPEGYAPEIVWEGLSLVDFSIVPHVQSDHAETEMAAATVRYMTENGIEHRPLRDGEAIVRDASGIRLVGRGK